MTTTRPGYIWSGSEWVAIGQEAVVAPVKYQASAPSAPATGDIWIDSDDDVPGIDTSQFLRWRKTVAGGETSVSGTDDNGLTLTYTPNYEQVYLNGVLLVRGQDYTATNGTSITGLTALAASDVVEVFGVVARVVGDVYTQAQTDAKYSPVTTTGLVLLSTATIGSAVSSVTVSNAFNSTYANYKITINGGTCSNNSAGLQLKLGSSTASYYMGLRGIFYAGGDATETTNNSSAFNQAGSGTNNWLHMNCDLFSPYLANYTTAQFQQVRDTYEAIGGGVHKVATSYTDFTVTPDVGTLTGGTIKVYGYK